MTHIVHNMSHKYLRSYIYSARLGWTIEVARVAVCALVEVFLEDIEDVLHSGIELQLYASAHPEGVCHLCR